MSTFLRLYTGLLWVFLTASCVIDTVPLPEAHTSEKTEDPTASTAATENDAADATDNRGNLQPESHHEVSGAYVVLEPHMVFGLPNTAYANTVLQWNLFSIPTAPDGSFVYSLKNTDVFPSPYVFTAQNNPAPLFSIDVSQPAPSGEVLQNIDNITFRRTAQTLRIITGPTPLAPNHKVVVINLTQQLLHVFSPQEDGSLDIALPYTRKNELFWVALTPQGPHCFENIQRIDAEGW
jgi:hypothetical protein